MRYFVRDAAGHELVVPTLGELHDLYNHGFLSDNDLVRAETASRWVRVGAMPALRGVRETRADPRRVLLIFVAAAALAAGIAILFEYRIGSH